MIVIAMFSWILPKLGSRSGGSGDATTATTAASVGGGGGNNNDDAKGAGDREGAVTISEKGARDAGYVGNVIRWLSVTCLTSFLTGIYAIRYYEVHNCPHITPTVVKMFTPFTILDQC